MERDYEKLAMLMVKDCMDMKRKPIAVLLGKEAYEQILSRRQRIAHRQCQPEPRKVTEIHTVFGLLPVERAKPGDFDYVDVGVRFDS